MHTSSRRILVVEDHPDVSHMMLNMLRMLGHEPTAASSMRETEEEVAKQRFDLLLVDYRLPDGNGSDVLKRLPTPVPAVLLTAHEAEALSPSALEGFAACLSKPVDMDALERIIRRTCGI